MVVDCLWVALVSLSLQCDDGWAITVYFNINILGSRQLAIYLIYIFEYLCGYIVQCIVLYCTEYKIRIPPFFVVSYVNIMPVLIPINSSWPNIELVLHYNEIVFCFSMVCVCVSICVYIEWCFYVKVLRAKGETRGGEVAKEK